jgi:hypothetical protein
MKAMKKAISILGSNLNLRVEEGYIWAASGDQLQAKKILSEIEALDQNSITPYVMYALAALRAKLNQTEKAIQILQDAYEKRSYRLIYLNVDPWFESIKSITEVKTLISNLGLAAR